MRKLKTEAWEPNISSLSGQEKIILAEAFILTSVENSLSILETITETEWKDIHSGIKGAPAGFKEMPRILKKIAQKGSNNQVERILNVVKYATDAILGKIKTSFSYTSGSGRVSEKELQEWMTELFREVGKGKADSLVVARNSQHLITSRDFYLAREGISGWARKSREGFEAVIETMSTRPKKDSPEAKTKSQYGGEHESQAVKDWKYGFGSKESAPQEEFAVGFAAQVAQGDRQYTLPYESVLLSSLSSDDKSSMLATMHTKGFVPSMVAMGIGAGMLSDKDWDELKRAKNEVYEDSSGFSPWRSESDMAFNLALFSAGLSGTGPLGIARSLERLKEKGVAVRCRSAEGDLIWPKVGEQKVFGEPCLLHQTLALGMCNAARYLAGTDANEKVLVWRTGEAPENGLMLKELGIVLTDTGVTDYRNNRSSGKKELCKLGPVACAALSGSKEALREAVIFSNETKAVLVKNAELIGGKARDLLRSAAEELAKIRRGLSEDEREKVLRERKEAEREAGEEKAFEEAPAWVELKDDVVEKKKRKPKN